MPLKREWNYLKTPFKTTNWKWSNFSQLIQNQCYLVINACFGKLLLFIYSVNCNVWATNPGTRNEKSEKGIGLKELSVSWLR